MLNIIFFNKAFKFPNMLHNNWGIVQFSSLIKFIRNERFQMFQTRQILRTVRSFWERAVLRHWRFLSILVTRPYTYSFYVDFKYLHASFYYRTDTFGIAVILLFVSLCDNYFMEISYHNWFHIISFFLISSFRSPKFRIVFIKQIPITKTIYKYNKIQFSTTHSWLCQ